MAHVNDNAWLLGRAPTLVRFADATRTLTCMGLEEVAAAAFDKVSLVGV